MAYTRCWIDDPDNTAAETNNVPDEGSMTIVEVTPTVGEMSPQGSMPAGTGDARWSDHDSAPLVADNPYTVSFSVATKTWPSSMRGSP
jgi:hypothetical protein